MMHPMILASLAVFAAALLLRHLRQRGFPDPTCARCDYIVAGLPGQTCPECGSDLGAPGAIWAAGRRRPMHRGNLLVIVALFTTVAASILTPMIVERLPALTSHYERYDLTPKSGAFVSVLMLHSEDAYPLMLGTIKITIDPPSRVLATIEVNPITMKARYPGQEWKPTESPFTPEVVKTVFATTGIKSSAESEEAQDIVNRVDAMIHGTPSFRGPLWSSFQGSTRSTRYVPRWYWIASYGAFAGIGLIIFVFLVRRRKVAPAMAQAQSSPAA